jgi:hypothetical protein
MDPLFQFPGAVERDAAVDNWLNSGPDELRSIAREWFAEMRACGDDVRELMHDGCPVACVKDAAFAYVNTFTLHAIVGFFNGVALRDPARMLVGSGKRMRHVKLKPGLSIDSPSLAALIYDAYLDMKARVQFG